MNKQKARTDNPARGTRYLRRALYFTVAVTLVLLLLPHIIRYELLEVFKDAGAESIQIGDIDYNPFTAVISINQLQIQNDQKVFLKVSTIQLNVGYFPILRRRLIIYDADLHNAEILIERDQQGVWTIAGFTVPENNNSNETEGDTWQAGIESLSMSDSTIRAHINKQDHQLQINSAKLEKLRTWEADNEAHLTFNGAFNGTNLELDVNMSLFGETLGVFGRIDLDTLELQPLMPDLYGQLTVTGKMAVKLEEQGSLHISHDGDFILTNTKYTHPELAFSASDITIKGKNSVTLYKGSSGQEQVKLTHSGSLSVKQSSFLQPGKNIELLRFSKFDAKYLDIKTRNNIELTGIQLTQTSVLRDTLSSNSSPVARSELITIDQLSLVNLNNLNLGNIVLDKLQLVISRDKQGALTPMNKLSDAAPAKSGSAINSGESGQSSQASDSKTVTGTDNKRPAFIFKMSSLSVTGDSSLSINDASVEPEYRSQLQIKKAESGKLDSTQIQQPTSLQLELLPEKFGSVKLSGNVYPFTPQTDMDLTLISRSISLPRLSPYLAHYTGYQFRQGQLDSDSTLKSTSGELSGQMGIVARNLEVAPVSTSKASQLRKQIGMPLEQALAMLRDANNNIKLDIPVSGNMANPDFSLGNVINIAITKAIKTGVSSYLLYALGPYGIALALADSALNPDGFVMLKDIEYEPGQIAFPEDQHDYLQRLQKITVERPEVELRLCAHATEHDRMALLDTGDSQNINHDQQIDTVKDNTAILKLAEQRMLNLKQILTKEYAVKSKRIILCKPFVDGDKYANPHVEVSL
ncbi:MAG TPA: DUF748 domain-containing protein [Gammaproteobacteria bacterium]|nr:DUF748 domain-containing protein [Gammaproteobacteria bacterium]